VELTEKLMERVEKNPLFKRFVEVGIKEKLFSDVVGAFGYMQNKVSKCAYLELIGRSMIAARFTKWLT
jgi:hypothetical protein